MANMKDICKKFDDVKYIFSGENLGFGAGHNLAFKNFTIKSNIHMIINPDIYFNNKEITSFLKWFSCTTDISLAIPNIYNPDNTIQNVVRNIPTPISLIKRKLGINNDEIIIKKNKITDIPFAHGCFMVFKTDSFRKIDGFDERFFIYMEDVDIFIRSKKYGRTVINSKYKIYHEYRKASSKKLKLFLYHILSAVKFFYKYKNIKLI